MKLGIIVGHTANAKGAYSPTFDESEYPWNTHLAELMSAVRTDISMRVFFRDGHGIRGAYSASDLWGANGTVELHFNASHNETSTGTGILYYPGSKNGRRFAGHLFDSISGVLQLPEWPRGTGGVVTPFQASGEQRRGQGSLAAGRAPATLIEPFFGSNPSDCRVAGERKERLAEAIVHAAEAYAGLR